MFLQLVLSFLIACNRVKSCQISHIAEDDYAILLENRNMLICPIYDNERPNVGAILIFLAGAALDSVGIDFFRKKQLWEGRFQDSRWSSLCYISSVNPTYYRCEVNGSGIQFVNIFRTDGNLIQESKKIRYMIINEMAFECLLRITPSGKVNVLEARKFAITDSKFTGAVEFDKTFLSRVLIKSFEIALRNVTCVAPLPR